MNYPERLNKIQVEVLMFLTDDQMKELMQHLKDRKELNVYLKGFCTEISSSSSPENPFTRTGTMTLHCPTVSFVEE